MNKRICFVAGFDANGQIADYVVYLVKALSQFADVYYYGDFDASEATLAKLKPYCIEAFARRHGKYDFGSWQELIHHVGRQKISQYDELILTNDSCYGPLFDLAPLFAEMEGRNNDFWGLTSAFQHHLHIQSYFIAFKKPVLQSDTFYQFFDSIKPEKNFHAVCSKYEDRLTFVLNKVGFTHSTFIDYDDLGNHPYVDAMNAIVSRRFPFLKVKFFLGGIRDQGPVADWRGVLTNVSDYPIFLIEDDLEGRGYNLAEIDSAVRERRPEGNGAGGLRPKTAIKHAVKLLLRPFLELFDARVDDKVNYQFTALKKRITELTEQLDLPSDQSDYILSDHKTDTPLLLGAPNVFRVARRDLKFPLTRESEVLTIGRFGDYDLATMGIEDSQVIALNNEWLESDPYSYKTKFLTNFFFHTINRPRILFDFIISQPLHPKTTPASITAFIDNLKSSMHAASVLVLAVPSHQKKTYTELLSKAGLHPARTERGLSVSTDPYRIYRDKINTIKGYKALIYKLDKGES